MTPAATGQAEEILAFWFADATGDAIALARCTALWFGSDPAFDARIRERFGDLAAAAAGGGLEAWGSEARSTLALVILLDQFPRNLHRNSPLAFASDQRALAHTLRALERGLDRELAPVEALFLALPLEHAEQLDHQERMVAFCEDLVRRVPSPLEQAFAGFASYARRHRDVIERFGRFPHRNRLLGRASTPEEESYLSSGGESFAG